MIKHCHPNFPPSLAITPNVGKPWAPGTLDRAFGEEAQIEAIARYGIAGRVWEAAHALCAYVASDILDLEFDQPFIDDPTGSTPPGVIELGSGTGVVAETIARTIQHGFVIATDLPDVCPLLQHNLGIDGGCDRHGADVFVRPLAWGSFAHASAIADAFAPAMHPFRRLTHIVCSDLASTLASFQRPRRSSPFSPRVTRSQVYAPELLGPLLRTLIHLTSPSVVPTQSKIVISYKIRSLSKETPFWTAFGLWFAFQPVLTRSRVRAVAGEIVSDPWRQYGADNDEDRTFVFVAQRRPESIAWYVPNSDSELMQGVGARGTVGKKGDDTFEMILFMSIGIDQTRRE